MTNKELNVYSKLYDITESNLSGTGMDMETCKETFMKVLQVRPEYTDLAITYDVPSDKYLQVMYSLLLKRLITDEEMHTWAGRQFDSDEAFRNEVMKSVAAFTERRKKNTIIYNYVEDSEEISYSMGWIKKKFRKFKANIKAMLPVGLKIKIKKIYLKLVDRG